MAEIRTSATLHRASDYIMKLRDIQILNNGKHSEEKLEQNRFLMFYWENIRNLFCMNLPDDIELFGISKLNIQLG